MHYNNVYNFYFYNSLHPLPMNELEWFTDGSKTKSGTGVRIQVGRKEYVLPMRMNQLVFQSDITALMECIRENLRLGYEDKDICLYRQSSSFEGSVF